MYYYCANLLQLLSAYDQTPVVKVKAVLDKATWHLNTGVMDYYFIFLFILFYYALLFQFNIDIKHNNYGLYHI